MNKLISSCHQVIPDAAGGGVPEWLHLIPAGTFKGFDGRGPFHVKNAAALIANSMANGNKLAIDENHSTDLAATSGAPSPARGWIVELQARDDGIWGRVEWNESGTQLMADKAYRGISPVFDAIKSSGEVVLIRRAALTNNPNLLQLKTLHHQETGVDLITRIRAAMGLPDTADEAAVLAAVTTAHTAVQTHAQQIAASAAAAGVTAADPNALVTQLQAARTAAGDVQKMAGTIVELQTQLQTMQASQGRERAVAFVDGAIAAGKPIAPLRDHYITRHVADAASVEKEIGALVSVNAGGVVVTQRNDGGGGDDDELSQEEMAVCEKMGQDPKKFKEQRNAARKKKAA